MRKISYFQLYASISEKWSDTSEVSMNNRKLHVRLRCGGIFSDNVITNFLLILKVKEKNCENRLIFDKVKGFNKNCAILWSTLYTNNIKCNKRTDTQHSKSPSLY